MPQICDMGQTALLPFRRKACCGFFRPKNPTASAGFEPAICNVLTGVSPALIPLALTTRHYDFVSCPPQVFLWGGGAQQPPLGQDRPLTRFLDHTQRPTTFS